MSFPCPHCGGDLAFIEREIDEIKPIIPLDLQEAFKEPPEPRTTLVSPITPPYRSVESSRPRFTQKPIQTSPPAHPPSVYPPLRSSGVQTTVSVPPPPPPPLQSPIKEQSRTHPPTPSEESVEVPPRPISQPSTAVSKDKLDTGVPIYDDNKRFKLFESRFKHLESRSKQFESQNKKFKSKFKETDQQLKTLKKCMKTILKSNQKLESIYKDTLKDLKKSF
ncbi:MAG: hypothetical protein ACXAC8_18160 [Candidatus Hodarchaeales archaeon]|jgi:hypothetical protein